ncbi:uncharacterized protein LOC110117362 [Athalia rosae]|uniref:uncharacterized protein LOC110117362 n=1 Tax=Athalia rosae TaxID=37344 RepID=UPI002033B42E|nr:uncharacterized protein LOC110117362 [Athalia rosae]
MLLCRLIGNKPFLYTLLQDDQRPTEGVAWASEGRNVSTEFSNANAARPFYLRLQEPLSITRTPDKQTLLLTRNDLVGGKDFIGNNSEDRFVRLEDKLKKYYTSSSSSHDFVKRDTRSNGEVRSDQSNYPRIAHEYLRKQFYELCREKVRQLQSRLFQYFLSLLTR